MTDRYSSDVLAPGWRKADRPTTRQVTLEVGMVLEDPTSGFCGAVMTWENGLVVLEDRRGKRRSFAIGPGFWLEGRPVEVVVPRRPVQTPGHTASGSLVAPSHSARVAQGSRLWVEGIHDAELVEKVWGDDLRYLGVVVEPIDGLDNLPALIAGFQPGPGRRVGVLADHLTGGHTKEDHLIAEVMGGPWSANILITGHPHVDVWQVVAPAALGIPAWPDVPRGEDWKTGICRRLGWPYRTSQDRGMAWRRILSKVVSWQDLDRAFVTEVEKLIDFVQPDDLD